MYKAARKKAGLSINEAALRLNIGPRTLFNYEAMNCAPPDVVMGMSIEYNDPLFPAKHCKNSCPIGQIYAHEVAENGLQEIAIGIRVEWKHLGFLMDDFFEVVLDGKVAEQEKPLFDRVVEEASHLLTKLIALNNYSLINNPTEKEKTPAYAEAR